MTIHTAHPIESTRHHIRFSADYRTRVSVPVIRRVFGLTLRTVCVDILSNECGIIRADWDVYYTFGVYTLAIVKR